MTDLRAEFEAFASHGDLWRYNLEIDKNGLFVCAVTQRAFNAFCDGWLASRAALKVELPATCCRALIIERGLFVKDDIFHDEYFEVDDIKQMLTDAGISYE